MYATKQFQGLKIVVFLFYREGNWVICFAIATSSTTRLLNTMFGGLSSEMTREIQK